MVKTITPFSSRAKEGATDSPLGDFVNVDQAIVSTADVGSYDQNTGKLTGVPSSDIDFILYQKDDAIGNGGNFLTAFGLDMTGYKDVQIALKPTNAGNYAIIAVMGSSGQRSYANLTPLANASTLRGNIQGAATIGDVLSDSTEALVADVWNIFYIKDNLRNQKLCQFQISNNSGGVSTVETTFLRIV